MLRLFIGNLPFTTTELDLRDVFKSHGFEVGDVKVVMDRETGRSRGFAFVSLDDDAAGNDAMKKLDGYELEGRQMRVNLANDRPSTGFRGNQGRSNGGGGGGGGGGRYRESGRVDRNSKHDKRDRRGRGDWD